MRWRFLILAAVVVLGVARAPLAPAQGVQPPSESSAPSYSDAELKSFAATVIGMQRVNLTYIPKLRAAATPEEQEQLARAASEAVEEVLDNEGMSIERFEEILTNARSSPQLAERVRQHLTETR